jgi:hypothetical protein
MIMNVLGKLFKKKNKLKPSTELKLCIIDDSTSDLWITLGITEQRRDEIVKICKEAYNNHSTKTDSYKEIVDQCQHVNEVIPACIVFERLCDLNNNPLAGLFQAFGHEND